MNACSPTLRRISLTQQNIHSSQVAPCALHVRVHARSLAEDSTRRLQVPRRSRLELETSVVAGHHRLARQLRFLCSRLRLL